MQITFWVGLLIRLFIGTLANFVNGVVSQNVSLITGQVIYQIVGHVRALGESGRLLNFLLLASSLSQEKVVTHFLSRWSHRSVDLGDMVEVSGISVTNYKLVCSTCYYVILPPSTLSSYI